MIRLSEAIEACKSTNYHNALAVAFLQKKGHDRQEAEQAIDTIFRLTATTRRIWEDADFYGFAKE